VFPSRIVETGREAFDVNLVVLALLALLVAGIPAGAEATGLKVTVNGGPDLIPGPAPQDSTARANLSRDPRLPYQDPRLQYRDPRTQYLDPRRQPDPRRPEPSFGHHHDTPVVVIAQPVYVTVQQSCVVPGYWAYSWMPQSYVSNVWVPGYYNSDALWVEGHYEPRASTWGYYQPYWVPERAC
jgi:hypothetical protein